MIWPYFLHLIPGNTFCGSLGDLPPTTEDCQTIKDAIQIFAGNAGKN